MPVIYADVVKYSGHACDRFVKRQSFKKSARLRLQKPNPAENVIQMRIVVGHKGDLSSLYEGALVWKRF